MQQNSFHNTSELNSSAQTQDLTKLLSIEAYKDLGNSVKSYSEAFNYMLYAAKTNCGRDYAIALHKFLHKCLDENVSQVEITDLAERCPEVYKLGSSLTYLNTICTSKDVEKLSKFTFFINFEELIKTHNIPRQVIHNFAQNLVKDASKMRLDKMQEGVYYYEDKIFPGLKSATKR